MVPVPLFGKFPLGRLHAALALGLQLFLAAFGAAGGAAGTAAYLRTPVVPLFTLPPHRRDAGVGDGFRRQGQIPLRVPLPQQVLPVVLVAIAFQAHLFLRRLSCNLLYSVL